MSSERRIQPSIRVLWFGMLAGGLAWSAQLLVDYVLVGVRCATGADIFSWSVNVFSLLMAAITLVAIRVGFQAWIATGLGVEAEDAVDPALGRAALMSIGGALFNTLFLVLIVASMVPNMFMDPCLRLG